jgi:hypothetical protein
MATVYGVNATKRDNSSVPALENQGEKNSPLKVAYDEYTLTAAMAQNDIIKLMKLPAKARVINVLVYFDALDAAAGTLDIGWEANASDSADADGFFAALAVTSAGAQDMQGDQPTRPGVFKQFADYETQISATVTHSGGLDATSGSLKVCVLYTIG